MSEACKLPECHSARLSEAFESFANRCAPMQLRKHSQHATLCHFLRLLPEPFDLFLLGYVLHRSHNQRFKVGAVHRDIKPFPTSSLCLQEGIHLLFDTPRIGLDGDGGEHLQREGLPALSGLQALQHGASGPADLDPRRAHRTNSVDDSTRVRHGPAPALSALTKNPCWCPRPSPAWQPIAHPNL